MRSSLVRTSSRVLLVVVVGLAAVAAAAQTCPNGGTTVVANVVALDQPLVQNRLGAYMPGGMIFALQRDVCARPPSGQTSCSSVNASQYVPGQVMVKPYKRPRPMVLRVNQGQCLQINFTNLLSPAPPSTDSQGQLLIQPTTRSASIHAQGLELVSAVPTACAGQANGATCNDGSWVGQNPNGLVQASSAAPGKSTTYTYFASQQGSFLLYSTADDFTAGTVNIPFPTNAGQGAGDGGQLALGLFGAVHVEPAGAQYYRSQVTATDLASATSGTSSYGQPLINYLADYSNTTSSSCYTQGTCRIGPVLSMLCDSTSVAQGYCAANEIVHSDLTALITGPISAPNYGRFPADPGDPDLQSTYPLPDRQEPYREVTIVYHETFRTVQAFPFLYNSTPNASGAQPLDSGADLFSFNYGSGGIVSEILANRLGVGPQGECTGCKYEEFFLASWAVGDPAMVVDVPATAACTAQGTCSIDRASCNPGLNSQAKSCGTCNLASFSCNPSTAQATKAFFPDDPSNVYHSYLADHTKFRVLHGGVDLHHIHHQHAHQWIASPNASYGDYTDSQTLGPGSAFTMEMVYNGSGNVNQTVGDSIFHCHFYPHFASGMWAFWRVHDVYETGTTLTSAGVPVTGQPNRALPDGEIAAGTPIPAIVPMPSLPMPPMPALVQLASGTATNGATYVELCDNTSTATACNNPVSVLSATTPTSSYGNPGYPFFIPGVAGQRAPHPPMDFAYQCPGSTETCSPFGNSANNPQPCSCQNPTPLDGGLPRHVLLPCAGSGCTEQAVLSPTLNPLDFSKELLAVDAQELPDGGTFGELLAMSTFDNRFVSSVTSFGSATTVNSYNPSTTRPAQFVYNGLPPVGGAPYADPCIAYSLNGGQPPSLTFRSYKAADIQLDAVFNKEGWHFPQQRMLSLWGDVQDFLAGSQAPEPLFFRANSGECVSYTLANLVPSVYELDDFQVRTPTDILGQHIHLVKFDVTSSDGAGNGFNYEDGTFSPDEVRERIAAINATGSVKAPNGQPLSAEPLPFFGPGPGGRWTGAQATLQRWYADPLLGGTAQSPQPDQTLRTVFTHDHFGPSTHQQAGLYAALVIEPPGSGWYYNEPPAGKTGLVPFGGIDVAGTGQPVAPRTVTGYYGATLSDGGPTTWQAVVVTPNTPTPLDGSFREFLLAIQDSTLTYNPFGTLQSVTAPPQPGFCADNGASCTPATAATMYTPTSCSSGTTCYSYGFCADTLAPCVDPSLVSLLCGGACTSSCADNPQLSCALLPQCNTGVSCNFIQGIPGGQPCTSPTCNSTTQYQIATSSGTVNLFAWGTTPISPPASNPNIPETITLAGGTTNFSLNYRNEPLLQRVLTASGTPSTGNAGDMAFAYTSIARPNLQCQFTTSPTCSPYPPLTQGVQPGDPATPLLRANAGDDVQVRIVMGAHINPHNFTLYGLKWLMEPSFVDSGWRNSQVMSISEHFEVVTKVPPYTGGTSNVADYLYMAGASALEQAGGNWGLLRAYPAGSQSSLASLPQNQTPPPQPAACTPNVTYTVVANTYANWYPGSAGLQYSPYANPAIVDPQAILFVNCPNGPGNCQAPATPQPLVLRAAAGDCIGVTLYNQIPSTTNFSGAGGTQTSLNVGLHPQLVDFNVTAGNGFNVGLNPTQTAAPGGGTASYTWYAGNVGTSSGQAQPIPIEFGAVNLLPPDVLNHFQHGLIAALIIEPAGATCNSLALSSCTGTSAVITTGQVSFQEFVAVFQDGLPQFAGSTPTALLLGGDNLNAINYQSMPFNQGLLYCDSACSSQADVSCVLSNQVYFKNASGICTLVATPSAPIFTACAGDAVRIRLLHAGGINTNQVFELHGHNWSDSPYQSEGLTACTTPFTQTNLASSSVIDTVNLCPGYPSSASLSSWQGSHMGHGPSNHFDVVIDSAGGTDEVPGDYLFRSYPAMHFNLGPWGILRVQSCGGSGQAAAGGGGGR